MKAVEFHITLNGVVLLTALLLATCAPAQVSAPDLSWHTLDGGGATASSNGAYVLGGTVGQPDAGRLTTTGYVLSGGFWGFWGAAPLPGQCGNGILEAGEQCDDGNNVNGDCCSPACQIEPATTQCRPAADVCDVAEFCTGNSPSCPPDVFATNSVVCRPAAGECDVAENCTGSSAACPPDSSKPAETSCTDDGNACTTDACDGAGACTHQDNTAPCDDQDPCTSGDACGSGTCRPGQPITQCAGGDGCCPPGCHRDNDTDCTNSQPTTPPTPTHTRTRTRTPTDTANPTPTATPTATATRRAGFNVARRTSAPVTPGPLAPGGSTQPSGAQDLVAGGQDRPELVVLRNDGDGTFVPTTPVTIPDVSQGGFGDLVTSDLDGDGERDVVGTLPNADQIVIVRGDPERGLGDIDPHSVGGRPRQVRVADVSGDGIPDILATTDDGVVLLRGNAQHGFGNAQLVVPGGGINDIAVADLDGDGVLDLVLARPDGVEIRFGDGAGGYPPERSRFIPGAASHVAVADFTGDGRADLAVTSSQGSGIIVYAGLPQGLDRQGVSSTDLAVSALATIDVDGDGVRDLLVLDADGIVTVLFGGDPSGELHEDARVMVGTDVAPQLTVADLAGNNLPDIVLAAPAPGQLVICENVSVPQTPRTTPTPTGTPRSTNTRLRTDAPATLTPEPTEEPPTPDTGPTDTPTPPTCAGDCDGDGQVRIEEMVLGVSMVMGKAPMQSCPAFNVDGSDRVTIDELLLGAGNALNGCP
jgi:cysteine-rich repeat protein